jgi:hypothetical protein
VLLFRSTPLNGHFQFASSVDEINQLQVRIPHQACKAIAWEVKASIYGHDGSLQQADRLLETRCILKRGIG